MQHSCFIRHALIFRKFVYSPGGGGSSIWLQASKSFISLQLQLKCDLKYNHFRERNNNSNTNPWNRSLQNIDQTRLLHLVPTIFTGQASTPFIPQELSQNVYEEIADESLESLYTYFDEVLENSPLISNGEGCDVSYSSGVLTVKLGKHGTYVINKQTPNRQIWLSSPTSGPKRYDYINKTWIYKHDGVSLYKLLNAEIPKLLELDYVDFEKHCNIHLNN